MFLACLSTKRGDITPVDPQYMDLVRGPAMRVDAATEPSVLIAPSHFYLNMRHAISDIGYDIRRLLVR